MIHHLTMRIIYMASIRGKMVHVRTKEIYSKLGLSQSLNGPNQRFK